MKRKLENFQTNQNPINKQNKEKSEKKENQEKQNDKKKKTSDKKIKKLKHEIKIDETELIPDEWWKTVWQFEVEESKSIIKICFKSEHKKTIEQITENIYEYAHGLNLDKIQGMLRGLIMGDSLGVPHEFPKWMKCKYTGLTEHKFVIKVGERFGHPNKIIAPGQYSDDSEMMLCILRSITTFKSKKNKENKKKNKKNNDNNKIKYDAKDVIKNYIGWTYSNQPSIGSNTRNLFRVSTKTQKDPSGYEHYLKKFKQTTKLDYDLFWKKTSESFQSDGSLMRCAPLSCLKTIPEVIEAVKQDVWCSNPSRFVLSIEMIYIWILWMLVRDFDIAHICNTLKTRILPTIKNQKIQQLIFDSLNQPKFKTTENKGWLVHGFSLTLKHLFQLSCKKEKEKEKNCFQEQENSFTKAMYNVIAENPGSDTDTNAAIVGACVGAVLGWNQLMKEPNVVKNWPMIVASTQSNSKTQVPRPIKFQIADLLFLEKSLL